MRILLIASIFAFTNINVAFSTEYICVFETMLTADVAEYSSNYQEALDVKSRSKFVFDITKESLIVNGEEYVPVFSSSDNNGFTVYSNRDFPYVMFHFYPADQKIIMIGMQESKSDTFLKSDSLACYTAGNTVNIANLNGEITPKPLNSPTNALSQRLKDSNGQLSSRQQENIKQNDLIKEEEKNSKPEVKTISMEEIIIPPPR